MASRVGRALIVVSILLIATGALAQSGTSRRVAETDRLFQAFVEDAAIVPGQWWEGQVTFQDFDPIDSVGAGLVFALRPYESLEFGGRVGFASSDAPGGLPDGSGATDLDVWGKWYLGTAGGATDVSVGALLTVPTGDDAAGLGFDSFGLAVFGAIRHRADGADFVAHAGLRFNDDGQIFGFQLDGEISARLGVGVVVPMYDRLSVIGEANVESERFDGGDTDFRLLGGVNWHVTDRGLIRAAIGLGLTDGAPDAQLILGYAATF